MARIMYHVTDASTYVAVHGKADHVTYLDHSHVFSLTFKQQATEVVIFLAPDELTTLQAAIAAVTPQQVGDDVAADIDSILQTGELT